MWMPYTRLAMCIDTTQCNHTAV